VHCFQHNEAKKQANGAERFQQNQDHFALEMKEQSLMALQMVALSNFWIRNWWGSAPPAIPWSCSNSLSGAVRSKCSAASATKETPAIAAFSHFLYAADEARPNENQLTMWPAQKFMISNQTKWNNIHPSFEKSDQETRET